jgi:hypothetical protein
MNKLLIIVLCFSLLISCNYNSKSNKEIVKDNQSVTIHNSLTKSEKKEGNFELSLEWKVSEGGNSGIFYLAQEKPDQSIWKSAPEMQILDNAKHPDAKLGVDGNRAAGSLYDLIPGKFEAVKPAGEWNKVKIMVYKGTVVHWMNGEYVLEYHLWTQDWNDMVAKSKFKDYKDFVNTAEEGYIGLQDHGDDVWFRNIKIKEL